MDAIRDIHTTTGHGEIVFVIVSNMFLVRQQQKPRPSFVLGYWMVVTSAHVGSLSSGMSRVA